MPLDLVSVRVTQVLQSGGNSDSVDPDEYSRGDYSFIVEDVDDQADKEYLVEHLNNEDARLYIDAMASKDVIKIGRDRLKEITIRE